MFILREIPLLESQVQSQLNEIRVPLINSTKVNGTFSVRKKKMFSRETYYYTENRIAKNEI